MTRTLVVEDDPVVQSALVHTLQDLGHDVRAVSTAGAALYEAEVGEVDLVLFDLGLPDLDGVIALRRLRNFSSVPVIVSTARSAESSLLDAFEAGADDYIVKPFSRKHLAARVNAVLRRTGDRPAATAPDVFTVGENLEVDLGTRSVKLNGTTLSLTKREFDLLAYLAGRQGRVVTRRELFREVWDQSEITDKTVDVHTSWLRRKLGETAAAPRYLHTVRGVGLKLVAPDR
ncbi:response regulator transcription factor [Lentzea sp. NPDC059081]|uniref:response regulator transcription factor n=1 Tax=Lentzea sp. NPDC059081 TaxID=3346719 RepID=UPI003684517D